MQSLGKNFNEHELRKQGDERQTERREKDHKKTQVSSRTGTVT
jgi:hypothetical protein